MIPFVDLQAQYRNLRPDLEAAVLKVLESGSYVLGAPVSRFEEEFAAYCGCRHAVAVNSGTSAVHLALLASGVGPGDEVVTTAMTFVATSAAILYTGARPVLVDIDPATGTIDPLKISEAIGDRTKAILPVHLHGLACDMGPIMQIAAGRGIAVIEDAAQAHGAIYMGQRVGGIGHLGCFSFYPSKNLGACGEGGAVVTNNSSLADAIRQLRDWGQDGRHNHVLRGYNYRMESIQGAVLRVKLRYLDLWTELRQAHARRYDSALADCPFDLPRSADPGRHVYHVYAPRLADRDFVQGRLAEAAIATGNHYRKPVHLQPAYAGLGYAPGDFPAAERFADTTLSLPMYPELTNAKIDEVCAVLREASRDEAA
jgi:dTDP-4-amino-4,6-dideoxygalactose transaminase